MRAIQVEQFHPSAELSFDISVYRNLAHAEDGTLVFKMHEDFELTALFNCSGKRIVGNSISNFSKGDLFLLGPNLPHLIKVDDPEHSSAICIHFRLDSFGDGFFNQPQNQPILKLLNSASLGCHFFGKEVKRLKQELKVIPGLGPFDKMMNFLQVLYRLSKMKDMKLLSSVGYRPVLKQEEAKRITLIYDYIIENFNKKLKIENMAALIHVSPSTFYRHFKRSMNKNFTEFLSEVRIGHACNLLINSDKSIAEICYLSGFQQITNFNRQFKKIHGISPKAYRKNYSQFHN